MFSNFSFIKFLFVCLLIILSPSPLVENRCIIRSNPSVLFLHLLKLFPLSFCFYIVYFFCSTVISLSLSRSLALTLDLSTSQPSLSSQKNWNNRVIIILLRHDWEEIICSRFLLNDWNHRWVWSILSSVSSQQVSFLHLNIYMICFQFWFLNIYGKRKECAFVWWGHWKS